MPNDFKNVFEFLNKVPDDIRVRVKRVFSQAKVDELLRDLKAHSPVDTGDYRDNWQVDRARYTDGSVIAGVRLFNETPYAYAMEYGGDPGGNPWPWFPRVTTGRLKEVNGKVWAGGFTPGHGSTVGGAIEMVSKKNKDFRFLAKELSDDIVKGWQ